MSASCGALLAANDPIDHFDGKSTPDTASRNATVGRAAQNCAVVLPGQPPQNRGRRDPGRRLDRFQAMDAKAPPMLCADENCLGI